MNFVHPIHDDNIRKIRKALKLAAPIVKEEIRSLVEGHCYPEAKKRSGSVRSGTGHWFNEDTIDERNIIKELESLRHVQTNIEDALSILNF